MHSAARHLATHLVLFALCARVLVPTGYMPGDTNDGWHLQLCPDGLSQATASVLLGAHHEHLHHGSYDTESTCELGAYSNTLLTNNSTAQEATPQLAQRWGAGVQSTAIFRTPSAHRSRAPPQA